MSATETKFSFKSDGRLYREDITLREIAITPQIAQSMCSGMSLQLHSVEKHDHYGQFNVCLDSNGTAWWTACLPKLTLRCPWRMLDGKWVPNLDNPEDPIQTLEWTPPKGMRLAFLCATKSAPVKLFVKDGHSYLFAYDDAGTTYRLPLGNLYDECRICLGSERFAAATWDMARLAAIRVTLST